MQNGLFLRVFLLFALCFYSEAADKVLHNRLYQDILTTNADTNIIFSPFSIQLCLALAHAGADGVTAKEIGDVIGYSENFKQRHMQMLLGSLNQQKVLQIANKVYVKSNTLLSTQYEFIVRNHLKSDVELIDFSQKTSSAKNISDWIATQTNQKIQNMVTPDMIDDWTKVMLVNAIYFKAPWETKLGTPAPDRFTNHDQSISMVPMMFKEIWLPMKHIDKLSATVVKLSYRNSNIAMYLVIPDATNGLPKLEQNLNQLNFLKINSQLESTFMNFYMPKFEFETSLKLAETLKRMGMQTAFSGNADFSNMMSSGEGLTISDAIHQSFIKVDEKGTEAGAVTVLLLAGSSMMGPSVTVKADRPFLFAIVSEDYEIPLFMGAVKSLK